MRGKFSHVFKEELEPHDRMKVEPVKLKLKEGYILTACIPKKASKLVEIFLFLDLRYADSYIEFR